MNDLATGSRLLLLAVLESAAQDAFKSPPHLAFKGGPLDKAKPQPKNAPPVSQPPSPADEARRWFMSDDTREPNEAEGRGITFLWLHSAIIGLGGSLPSVERIRDHVLRKAGEEQRMDPAA